MNTQTYISNNNSSNKIELTAAEVLEVAMASERFAAMQRQYPLAVVISSEALIVTRDGEEYRMLEGMPKSAIVEEIKQIITA
jgi:hypothetical protein